MFKKILWGITAVIAVMAMVYVYAAYGRKDLTLPKAYVKEKYSFPNSHFLSWRGAELHYTESGKGFPILMIHGFGGSNWDFRILDSLLNDQYKVIRIDMPGFGLSDFPKQTEPAPDYIQVYNDYFNFLLDTLHLDSCYVMGNSLGGLMSWNLAVRHPEVVKKLVLFNSAGYDMKEVIKTAHASVFRHSIVQSLLKHGIPLFVTKRGMRRVFYNKEILTPERERRINELWNREGNLQHIMNMACSEKYLDQNLIKQVKCPTLIVWGKQDKIVAPKYAARFHEDIPNSRVIMYDSCGHVPMLERTSDVRRDVLQFLKE